MVAIFCGALLGGERPRVFGDGEQTRDYVYVGDVAARLRRRRRRRGAPAPYNIGTGIETSVLELGERDRRRRRREFDPEIAAAAARRGAADRRSIPRRAAAELGWRAEHDLAPRGSS